MDKAVEVAATALVILLIGGVIGYSIRGKCKEVDPLLIESLEQSARVAQERATYYEGLANQYALEADSLKRAMPDPKTHVQQVLTRTPSGRSDRSLDSLRTILLQSPQ